MRGWVWGALLAVTAIGCDAHEERDASVDAALDARAILPDAAVEPPMIPWLDEGRPPIELPVLTPCPEGWREVPPSGEGGVVSCDPYPPGGPSTCAFGEVHFPGEPGCAPVGSACPAGEWADGLADDGSVLFVRPGASGDGTRAAPFGAIADAMAVATSGSTIALAKGTYDESVVLGDGVTVAGACAAETRIDDTGGTRTGVDVRGTTGGVVRDVALTGGWVGVQALDAGEVTLDGVWISDAELWGILAQDGARVTGRSILVRRSGAMDVAVVMYRGAVIDLERAVIEDGDSDAVRAFDGGASLQLSNAVIRDFRPGDNTAYGVTASEGSATLLAVLVEAVTDLAVAAQDGGLVLEDVVVRNTRASPIGVGGVGVQALRSTLSLERTLVEGGFSAGVVMSGGDVLRADDLVVRGVRSTPRDGHFGRGLQVQDGSSSIARRILVEDCRDLGVALAGPSHTVSNVWIRDIGSRASDGEVGGGLLAVADDVMIGGLVVERTRDIALTARGADTRMQVTDALLSDTRGAEGSGLFGRGVEVSAGATLTLSRAVVEGGAEIGVLVLGEGSSAELSDVVVSAISQVEVIDAAGMGLAAVAGRLTATRFRSENNDLCGLLVTRGGEMDLSQGVIAGNPIGACVQVDVFDTDRLLDGVLFLDNETNFEAVSYEPPAATAPGEI